VFGEGSVSALGPHRRKEGKKKGNERPFPFGKEREGNCPKKPLKGGGHASPSYNIPKKGKVLVQLFEGKKKVLPGENQWGKGGDPYTMKGGKEGGCLRDHPFPRGKREKKRRMVVLSEGF